MCMPLLTNATDKDVCSSEVFPFIHLLPLQHGGREVYSLPHRNFDLSLYLPSLVVGSVTLFHNTILIFISSSYHFYTISEMKGNKIII